MNAEETRPHSLEENIKSRSAWMRLLYMLLFSAILGLMGIVLSAVAVVQFVIFLLTREPNPNLRELGLGMASYAYQAVQFLCFNSDHRPFPFAPWPKHPLEAESVPAEAVDEDSGV